MFVRTSMSCWNVYNAQNCYVIKNHQAAMISPKMLHIRNEQAFQRTCTHIVCQIDFVVCKCNVLTYTKPHAHTLEHYNSAFASTLVYFPIKCCTLLDMPCHPTVLFRCEFSIHFPLHCHFNYFNMVWTKEKNRDVAEHVFIETLKRYVAAFISQGVCNPSHVISGSFKFLVCVCVINFKCVL